MSLSRTTAVALPRWLVGLACLALAPAPPQGPTQATPAEPAEPSGTARFVVNASREVGGLPRVFRPSVFPSWASGPALEIFTSEMRRIGAVRMRIETQLSDSRDLNDLLGRLPAVGRKLARMKRGTRRSSCP